MTTSTFYSDPSPEVTSVDGFVQEGTDQGFTDMRNDAGDNSNNTGSSAATRVECTATTDVWNRFFRIINLFDTSALGSEATIDSASFEFVAFITEDNLGTAESLSLVATTPSSNTTLVNGDYAQFGTTKQATDKTLAGINSDNTTYNVYTLNAAGEANISKTSISKFGLRITGDNDNSDPGWVSGEIARTTIRLAETADTTKDAKLVITFTVPATGSQIASSGII